MTCRSCGAEIDAKAIICYRCGAATADSTAARPRRARWAPRRVPVVLTVAVIVILAAAIAYLAWWPGGPG